MSPIWMMPLLCKTDKYKSWQKPDYEQYAVHPDEEETLQIEVPQVIKGWIIVRATWQKVSMAVMIANEEGKRILTITRPVSSESCSVESLEEVGNAVPPEMEPAVSIRTMQSGWPTRTCQCREGQWNKNGMMRVIFDHDKELKEASWSI